MTVVRMMGTETEYAISMQGPGRYDPVGLSFDVVAAAADERTSHIRWDYRQEDPLNDARGMRLPRADARPDMLTDEPQRQVINVIAPNGGRIYVDHAHPEYSAPETLDPFTAVGYDRAGDTLMFEAACQENERRPSDSHIALHRNNVDGKGASWGTHENYMMCREVPFDRIVKLMTLHFVTRQIYSGSGRVGLGEHSEMAGYQLSQRADYIHAQVGLQTTFNRPIVNARDESHVTRDDRRLHVIVGDANRMDIPQALKLGTTSMLLWLLEQDYAPTCVESQGPDCMGMRNDSALTPEISVCQLLEELEFVDPVGAMNEVSHDLSLATPLVLRSGRTATAWQIQVRLLMAVAAQGAAVYGTNGLGDPLWPDEPTRRIMRMWKQALADVATVRHGDEDDRLHMTNEASRLEWLLKWQLLERFRRKVGTGWDDVRLAALDLGWGALDPATSVYAKVENHAERLDTDGGSGPGVVAHDGVDDSFVQHEANGQQAGQVDGHGAVVTRQGYQSPLDATRDAPVDTRAWLRGEMLRRFGQDIVAMSWSHITVRDRSRYSDGLFCLDISDPLLWTERRCGSIMRDAAEDGLTAAETLRRLAAVENR